MGTENQANQDFNNTQKIWYLSIDGGQEGPFTYNEINDKLSKKEASFKDYVFKEGMPDWAEIGKMPMFGTRKPPQGNEPVILREKPTPDVPALDSLRSWYLYSSSKKAQEGPFTFNEIKAKLDKKEYGYDDYIWSEMIGPNWRKIAATEQFNRRQTVYTERDVPGQSNELEQFLKQYKNELGVKDPSKPNEVIKEYSTKKAFMKLNLKINFKILFLTLLFLIIFAVVFLYRDEISESGKKVFSSIGSIKNEITNKISKEEPKKNDEIEVNDKEEALKAELDSIQGVENKDKYVFKKIKDDSDLEKNSTRFLVIEAKNYGTQDVDLRLFALRLKPNRDEVDIFVNEIEGLIKKGKIKSKFYPEGDFEIELARLFYKSDDQNGAIKWLKLAIEKLRGEKRYAPLKSLGLIYLEQKKYQAAVANFKKAMEYTKNPDQNLKKSLSEALSELNNPKKKKKKIDEE